MKTEKKQIKNYRARSSIQLGKDLLELKHDPSLSQRAILDQIPDANITNPSNPFIFLLESIIASGGSIMQDHYVSLRKHYASMAIERKDLYLTMSDADYMDRFATPSSAQFKAIIEYDSLEFKMIESEDFTHKAAVIPLGTEMSVGEVTFSLLSPIEIREYPSGIVSASYLDIHGFEEISRTKILTEKQKLQNGRDLLVFDIDVKQYKTKTDYFTRESAIPFKKTIPFTDKFYTARAFYRRIGSKDWVPIRITHIDEMHNLDEPLMVLEVREDDVIFKIPDSFAIGVEFISKEIRLDVLTTKGRIDIALGDYNFGMFSHVVKATDEDRDWNDRTNAFAESSFIFISDKTVSGGRNEMTFEELKERVIFNNVKESKEPITNVDVEFLGMDIGFHIKTEVDDLTNRIFRATRPMEKQKHEKLLTSMGSMVSSFIFAMNEGNYVKGILEFGKRLTIKSQTLFYIDNGITKVITDEQHLALMSNNPEDVVKVYSADKILYNPFYYAVDITEREMVVGCYNLSSPSLSSITHVKKNDSVGRDLNTKSNDVTIGDNKITIKIRSTEMVNIPSIPIGDVMIQISFISASNGERYWIRSYQKKETLFEVSLKTSFEINPRDHSIFVENVYDATGKKRSTFIPLYGEILISYGTDSIPGSYTSEDGIVFNQSIERNGSGGITTERAFLSIGTELKWLWKNWRSSDYSPKIATRKNFKVKVWPKDVYKLDPKTLSSIIVDTETCSVKRCIIHKAGDPILDDDGNLQYEYNVGDLIPRYPGDYDSLDLFRSIDLLLFDAAYLLGEDPIYDLYVRDSAKEVSGWDANRIDPANKVVLEQSRIFFHPKNTLGTGETLSTVVNLEIGLKVKLVVPESIFTSIETRDVISKTIIKELDIVLGKKDVSMGSIYQALRDIYESDIYSMDIEIKGVDKFESMRLADGLSLLSINKVLSIRDNNTIEVLEDVDIEFLTQG